MQSMAWHAVFVGDNNSVYMLLTITVLYAWHCARLNYVEYGCNKRFYWLPHLHLLVRYA